MRNRIPGREISVEMSARAFSKSRLAPVSLIQYSDLDVQCSMFLKIGENFRSFALDILPHTTATLNALQKSFGSPFNREVVS
jgi:hypothetical protein